MKSVLILTLLGSPAWTAFAQESSKGMNFYSVAREIQLGQEASANLERALPLLREPKLDAYVQQLGSEMAKRADPQFAYSFAFYDDRKTVAEQSARMAMAMPTDAFSGTPVEAVAIAGGRVLIPVTLLARAPNEAVFAFQLAHSVAHISMRHFTRMASRASLVNNIVLPSMASNAQSPPNAPFPSQLAGLQASSPRQFELQADKEAARLMAEAGYNPEAAIQYLKGLPPGAQASVARSAHPAGSERAETVRSASEALPSRTYSGGDPGAFAEAKALASGAR
jgi:beta-barrel assembly-enhancing protease